MSSASGKCGKNQKQLKPLKSFFRPQWYMTVFEEDLRLTTANGFQRNFPATGGPLEWLGY